MSTTYYSLAEPLTGLTVIRSCGDYAIIAPEFAGKAAGSLLIARDRAADFLALLRGAPEAHLHFGGEKEGVVVEWTGPGFRAGLPAALVKVISETGDVTTMDAVLMLRGSGRKKE